MKSVRLTVAAALQQCRVFGACCVLFHRAIFSGITEKRNKFTPASVSRRLVAVRVTVIVGPHDIWSL